MGITHLPDTKFKKKVIKMSVELRKNYRYKHIWLEKELEILNVND